jgi:ribose transport system permease protein
MKLLGMALALLAMCLVIGLSNPNFASSQNLFNTSRQVALLGIYAVGVAFVIISGGIDLSIGSVISLAAVVVVKLSAPSSQGGEALPLWLGVAAALGIALSIGLLQGLLITRAGLQPFILTLAGMLIYRGVSQTILGGGDISFGEPADPAIRFLIERVGEGRFLGIPAPAVVFLGVMAAASFLLHFTVFGRYVYAIGGNREAARYSGIPVARVETATYLISAGLAGLAGVVYAAYLPQVNHNIGFGYELTAIAAAVLGGCSLRGGEGSIPGVLLGAAIMQVMDNGINMFQLKLAGGRTFRLDENWKYIIIGGVILGAVVLDGLMFRLRAGRKR